MPEKRKREAPAAEATPSKRAKTTIEAPLDTETLKQDPTISNAASSNDPNPSPASYRNYEVDVESDWAQQYQLQGLPGAEVFYQPDLVDEDTANRWYEQLCELQTWYRPTLSMYGKPYLQSRSIASYTTSPNLTARYSGHSVQMNSPYPPLLTEIQEVVSRALGVGFDHVMLNWYQDGSVHIGKHRDTKENQVIASLSLGGRRTFVMTPHVSKGEKKVKAEPKKWTLANGSLLVMQGDTQENWKHEIPKEPKVKDGRISLTFRQLVHETR